MKLQFTLIRITITPLTRDVWRQYLCVLEAAQTCDTRYALPSQLTATSSHCSLSSRVPWMGQLQTAYNISCLKECLDARKSKMDGQFYHEFMERKSMEAIRSMIALLRTFIVSDRVTYTFLTLLILSMDLGLMLFKFLEASRLYANLEMSELWNRAEHGSLSYVNNGKWMNTNVWVVLVESQF